MDDSEVSRLHARIRREPDECFVVEDLESSNGTFVNELPIHGKHRLRYGDKLRLGGTATVLVVRHGLADGGRLQQQRLETLARLAAGVVHDINNMLNVMLGNAGYLLKAGGDIDPDELRSCLEDIHDAAVRSAGLTPRLLAFSRGNSQAQPARIDLAHHCRECLRLLERTFDPSIQIRAELRPDIQVVADPIELHQVIMNLCLNARDAMPKGGVLTVSVARLSVEQARRWRFASKTPHAIVTVSDTGVGMDEQTLSRIFEPFFTTKKEGEGTGLGLATARELVMSFGGEVRVSSAPGEGSSFVVLLPCQTAIRRQHATLRKLPDLADRRGHERILVVEDEIAVQRSLARLLRRAGYDVLVAADGVEAMRVFTNTLPAPALVLLDVELPTMNGERVLSMLRELGADVRVLMMSGKADATLTSRVRAAGAVGMLSKPSGADELLAAVARAIDDHEPWDEDTARRSIPAGGAIDDPPTR